MGLRPFELVELNEKGRRYLLPGAKVWANNRYQVVEEEANHLHGFAPVVHLSIKRLDKKPIRSWRDLLWIKNELCGPERWAVEIFPAMAELVDTANQYHLWVLPEGMRAGFDLGNTKPVVAAGDGSTGPGQSRQQPLPAWYPEPTADGDSDKVAAILVPFARPGG